MNKSLSKILMIATLVIALIGVGLYFLASNAEEVTDSAMGNYVGYAILLLIVATGLSIVFSLLNMFKKPALLKKMLLSLGVLAVVLALAYFMADGEAVYDASGKVFEGSEGSTSRWVGTFINYSMILMFVGAILFLYDMIKNLIK